MNIRTVLLGIAVALTATAPAAYAGVVISGTRIIHDGAKGARDTTVHARNAGQTPAMVQVWLDEGAPEARPGMVHVPFRLTPAEPRLLEANQRQAFRFTYAPGPGQTPLPTDRESLFYFNLLDIPPKPADSAGKNLLQFAVRSRLKYFYRPAGLSGKPREAAGKLEWRVSADAGGQVLQIRNPSQYYVTLVGIVGKAGVPIEVDMVAPLAEYSVKVAKGNEVGPKIACRWIDDYGINVDAEAAVTAL